MDFKIMNHPLFTLSDYGYLSTKGYTDEEILAFWDRDLRQGHTKGLEHKSIPDYLAAVKGE